MKTSEVRDMTIDEIKTKEGELRRELFNLRMRHTTGQLENPLKLRLLRKDIARMKTVIAEKERGG
ncbi:MAG TPA: 50S ribosomal protein L29 [Thermodesulfobacteriota bacterium]|nr:50S ribosomal protein L29 [Thermodesulfobacteriota bacterium]